MFNKNFVAFVLIAVLAVGTWVYLTQVVFPPPPPTETKKDEPVAKAKDEPKKDEPKKQPDEPPAKKQDEPKLDNAAPPAEVTIGGAGDYYIEAVLTSRGAGVRRLALTRFEAANWLGRPDPDKTLQLLPDDPYEPSFRLYHYPEGNAERNPLLGLGERHWKHEKTEIKDDAQEVTFSATVPGAEYLQLVKTYRLEKRTYHLGLTLEIRAGADTPVGTLFRYQLTGGHGLPVEGEWYTATFRNAVVGMVDQGSLYRDLETSDRISFRAGGDRVPGSLSGRGNTYVQYAGVLNQYFASVIVADNVQPAGIDFKDLIAWARPTQESAEIKGHLVRVHGDDLEFWETGSKTPTTFRMLARLKEHVKELDLKDGGKAVLSHYTTPEGMPVATWIRHGQTPRASFDDVTVRVNSEAIKLKPGQTVAHRYLLYHGPAKTRLLGYRGNEQGPVDGDLVDRYTNTLYLSTLTDYQSPGALGTFSQTIHLTDLIILFTRGMHWILYLLSWIVPTSFSGLSIILLTVFVRGLMYPISRRQAMFSIKMQALAPELKKIQEKYKNDAPAKGQAVMELYRKHGVHPLGSCLPLLMQMPIFMGLYFALQESIQFRLAPAAPFLWIENLAAPDMLIWWTESIPFISEPDSAGGVFYLGPYLNLLPVFAVVLMVIQQQLMTPPATDEQQEAQQKMMKYMSIFFGIMFYKVAAGLCIYFISSSLWGLAERKLLPRKRLAAPLAETAVVANPQLPRRGPRGRNGPKTPAAEPGTLDKLKGWWAEVLRQAEKK